VDKAVKDGKPFFVWFNTTRMHVWTHLKKSAQGRTGIGLYIWLFVPVQQKLKAFLTTLPEYPFQQGSSLNAAGINYNSLQALQAMKRLKELESLSPPHN
jgi:hypothetical protein